LKIEKGMVYQWNYTIGSSSFKEIEAEVDGKTLSKIQI
jgi:hypothetical protein